jgi:hypothetical protein
VGHATVGELDVVGLTEVHLVVVEGGARGGLRPGDLDLDLELELLLALAGGHHPPAAPEERVAGDVVLGRQAEPAQKLHGPIAPGVAPLGHRLGRADSHDLALVKHLQPRRIARRLRAKDV